MFSLHLKCYHHSINNGAPVNCINLSSRYQTDSVFHWFQMQNVKKCVPCFVLSRYITVIYSFFSISLWLGLVKPKI